MDGYTIWLAPITGILLADYYIVHRQQYQVSELYDPDARYRYNRYGTNWRALAAFVVSWVPLTPGFAHAVSVQTIVVVLTEVSFYFSQVTSTNTVSDGALHLYYLSYLFAFCTSSLIYTGLSIAFPHGRKHIVREGAAVV